MTTYLGNHLFQVKNEKHHLWPNLVPLSVSPFLAECQHHLLCHLRLSFYSFYWWKDILYFYSCVMISIISFCFFFFEFSSHCLHFPSFLVWCEVKWKLFSRVRLFATPRTIQSMEFSRPEYWSGLPFLSPGDLPNSGIEPRSPTLQADALPAEPPGQLTNFFR